MKWTIGQLRKLPETFMINEVLNFKNQSELIEDMLDISDVHVEGSITRKNLDSFFLSLTIDTNLVLACAKTLEPVEYPLHIAINEWYGTDLERQEEEDYYLLDNNTLDLDDIVWSAILINKPIRVIHPDAETILAKQGISFDEAIPDDENADN